ncbi:MAG: aminopeptidase P N-terminal domain-containing protein [Bacteroidales bacterium]|jgi:Xaa-Pro aminopeptidase|nr:aminopeptidase P N-terminal domain-containing protein [Bacteroidales bacterium]
MATFLKKDFFSNNRKKLYNLLEPDSIVILFSADSYPRSGNQFFKFRQNSDIYYFSGLDQEETIVLLHKDTKSETINEYAFITEPDEEILVWTGHKYTKEEVRNISGIENTEYLDAFQKSIKQIINQADNIYYSFCGNIRAGNLKNLSLENLKILISQEYKNKNQIDLDIYSHSLRVAKEKHEIQTIQRACNITGECFSEILKYVRPGVYEYQVEAEITRKLLSLGAQDFAYLPIIVSGRDNCVLHYTTNRKVCNDGDLLLLDFGSELDYYASDVSRTIPVSGKYTKRQKEVYNSVLKVMKQIKQKFVTGNSIVNLNKECGELIQNELLQLGLLKEQDIKKQNPEKPAYKKYFMHGVSHYMGLDIHDVGNRNAPLIPGMILSCEPGIYIPEEGFGIRIENDILITENSPVDLCKDIPIEADEIEEIMNS